MGTSSLPSRKGAQISGHFLYSDAPRDFDRLCTALFCSARLPAFTPPQSGRTSRLGRLERPFLLWFLSRPARCDVAPGCRDVNYRQRILSDRPHLTGDAPISRNRGQSPDCTSRDCPRFVAPRMRTAPLPTDAHPHPHTDTQRRMCLRTYLQTKRKKVKAPNSYAK